MWLTPKSSQNVPCPSTIVNENQLKEVNHQTYLGIIFDKQLCWDHQVNDIYKQVAYQVAYNLHLLIKYSLELFDIFHP